MGKNIYNNLYSDGKNLGDLSASHRILKMAALLNELNIQNKNILDIGCYDGTFLALIRNRINNFFGLDASKWAVEQSRKKNINVQQFFLKTELASTRG